jgi:hypothetical protein
MIFPPSPDLIDNLRTQMHTLTVGEHVLPMTQNDGGRTCYICCPSEAYLAYAEDELRLTGVSGVMKGLLGCVINGLRPLMALSGLDKQVQPGNALVSTNILPALKPDEITEVTARLSKAYPDHVIVWRSVNDHDPKLKSAFISAGYKALPSRFVYVFKAAKLRGITHRDARRDQRLLAQADYRKVSPEDFTDADFERVAALYAKLYLDKYSPLNPHYTAAFLREAHRSGFLKFYGLCTPQGGLDGVIGFYAALGTLTAPMVGYDTDLPQSLGLYRRLMAIGLEQAQSGGYLYNMSAGAGAFKRNRGAEGGFEYMMVYDRHLKPHRRAAISALVALAEHVGKPALRRFET